MRNARPPAICASMRWLILSSSTTSLTPPLAIASRGMPNTTQLASFCAGIGPGAVHLQHPRRSVVAHPGEDHAHRIAAGILRHRAEQHVDRGAMAVDRRAVMQLYLIVGAAARQLR